MDGPNHDHVGPGHESDGFRANGAAVLCRALFFWESPRPVSSRTAACFGLINSVGHVGGFFGPSMTGYLNEWSGGTAAAFLFISGCYVLAGMIMLAARIRSAAISPTGELLPEGDLLS
jgi:nitrate/nitrite transporter NarK